MLRFELRLLQRPSVLPHLSDAAHLHETRHIDIWANVMTILLAYEVKLTELLDHNFCGDDLAVWSAA